MSVFNTVLSGTALVSSFVSGGGLLGHHDSILISGATTSIESIHEQLTVSPEVQDTRDGLMQVDLQAAKTCTKCQRVIGLGGFYSKGDRLSSQCKTCELSVKSAKAKLKQKNRDFRVLVQDQPDKRHLGSKLVKVLLSLFKEFEDEQRKKDRG